MKKSASPGSSGKRIPTPAMSESCGKPNHKPSPTEVYELGYTLIWDVSQPPKVFSYHFHLIFPETSMGNPDLSITFWSDGHLQRSCEHCRTSAGRPCIPNPRRRVPGSQGPRHGVCWPKIHTDMCIIVYTCMANMW